MSDWAFLLDENVDPKTVAYLGKEGINAEHVREALWLGADDEDDILPYARTNDRIVVTDDQGESLALQRGDESDAIYRKQQDSDSPKSARLYS